VVHVRATLRDQLRSSRVDGSIGISPSGEHSIPIASGIDKNEKALTLFKKPRFDMNIVSENIPIRIKIAFKNSLP
jgi:hypothetical protein